MMAGRRQRIARMGDDLVSAALAFVNPGVRRDGGGRVRGIEARSETLVR